MSVDVAHVRLAGPKDAGALSRAYEDAWRGAYQGIIPHINLERMIARRGQQWWQGIISRRAALMVLDFRGKASGYVTFGRVRAARGTYQGEIFELYLHPNYQGLGFGPQLFDSARQKLRDLGLKGLLVWALEDNEAACSFYLRQGGKPIARSCECFGEISLQKIAFAWP